MKKRYKKTKKLDTKLIEVVGNKSLIYPNFASMVKQDIPFFPESNNTLSE